MADAIRKELIKEKKHVIVHALDAFEHAAHIFRHGYPLAYYYLVKLTPRLWGFLYEFTDHPIVRRFLRPVRRVWNHSQSGSVRKLVQHENPDVIVSTHFYAAEIFADAKLRGEIQSQVITVVTDVMPHAFWVNEGTDIYWVMAEESRDELVRRGVSKEKICVGGIPINEEFRQKGDRPALAQKLNLSSNKLNILFSSGSFGIGPTQEWLQELSEFGDRVQALVVCGYNRKLYETLARERYVFPVVLMGFINNMHELMSVSDILIAKSGGATMCESLAKDLPMIISAPIPGQETRNATWLIKNEAALEIKNRGELRGLIIRFLNGKSELQKLKDRIQTIAKPNATKDFADFIVSGTQ